MEKTQAVGLSAQGQPSSQGNTTTLAAKCPACGGEDGCFSGTSCCVCGFNVATARRDAIEILGGEFAYSNYRIEKIVETPENKIALNACKNFDRKTQNIYLYGPTGSGKTHLSIAAIRKYLVKCSVFVTSPQKLLLSIRAAGEAWKEKKIIEEASYSKILILDDMGTEKPTEFAVTTLFGIIDRRYMNGGGGLIISSNLSLPELAAKLGDDRIPSRLSQMCKDNFYNLSGEKDWRLV